ncbi:MAG: cob(I)yrinic acid a,c-diamide adenosyltransferase [Planctomycetota bacterium]
MDIKWDMKTSLEDEQKRAEVETAITDVLARIAETAEKRFYDVIVLDEIVFCYSKGLAKLEDIKNIIEKKDSLVEIVLTGCGVDEKLMELADLVTEMKKIKHPFDKGINARCGIEY